MLDAMLVVHRCTGIAKAPVCRVPDAPLEPTIWVDAQGALAAWHPLMGEVLVSEGVSSLWTQDNFLPCAQDLLDGLRGHIEDLLSESGAPASYFSSYPSIVADVRTGQTRFTVAATDQDKAEMATDETPRKDARPKLDTMLRPR